MGKRELIALLNLSSWCLVMVERLFLAVPGGCLQFVSEVFPDHTHLLFSACQFDPKVYATRHDPKIYPHTKFRSPTSNYIQISSELDLARTETRGQGHSDLETFGDSRVQDVSTYQIRNATINKIGDLLWVHFFKN